MPSIAKTDGDETSPRSAAKGVRFWGIFAALCMLSFISALDVAIITTSLPTITAEIGGATQYIWIANAFTVGSSVLQPLYGQLADIFGRLVPFASATVLFTFGSGICGGAQNVGMLIAGRAIQGVGAGGVYLLLSIVCCDLVPLRQRGKYLGLMNACAGVAAALGPVVGGSLAQRDWRWIFYMNIPICGVALGMLLFFLRFKSGTLAGGRMRKLSQIDWLGNLIFTPSMVALLFGLTLGGNQYEWSSWRIILPLVCGGVGWVIFHIYQAWTPHPSIPGRLFLNRTSATGYLLTFISSVLVQAQSYFLPIYFQATLATTILQSGTNFLPFAIGTLGFAATSGILLSKFGAYRPLHATSFALSAIGFGLFTLLDDRTFKACWVIFELIASAGCGMILSVLLPAIMAALPEADVASASAAFAFMKTFGYVWGVTIASVIFNASINSNLNLVSQPALQDELKGGGAYAFASQMYVVRDTLPESLRQELALVYARSLRAIWWTGLGMSIVGFFAVGLERGLELRKTLDTDYGIEDKDSVPNSKEEAGYALKERSRGSGLSTKRFLGEEAVTKP